MSYMNIQKVFKLRCSVHNNIWGKIGNDSMVAQLLTSADDDFIVEEDRHYAELWMGTHSDGPSYLQTNGQHQQLKEWIANNPSCLGSNSARYSDGNLPFLFKVLSIRKGLAIQAHPDKALAETLHKERPDTYKDPNNKPEMAIAVTPFKAMVGFRHITEIVDFVTKIKPLREVIGHQNVTKLVNAVKVSDNPTLHRDTIKDCFIALITQDLHVIKRELDNLLQDINEKETEGRDIQFYIPDIVHKLNREYPGDVGILMIYFFNIISLNPGEAIFIDENIPHAYLSGDCIECMACSHNVIRAGLTHKYRDVETFCDMINYTGRPSYDFKLQPSNIDLCQPGVKETQFQPYIQDFSVSVIHVSVDSKTVRLRPIDSASVCLVQNGEGEAFSCTLKSSSINLRTGTVLFIAANETVTVDVHSDTMLIVRSYSGSDNPLIYNEKNNNI